MVSIFVLMICSHVSNGEPTDEETEEGGHKEDGE